MTGEEHEQFLNWRNFVDAWKVYNRFIQENFAESVRAHREAHPERYVPIDQIHVTPENLKKPEDDYFALFSDILGFSVEVSKGVDSLPDFYGAAFVGACEERNVRVYVLSDSCFAFCAATNAQAFLGFTRRFIDSIQADGIMHQSFIGYGSFVERSPEFGGVPSNFFGRQVAGTALVDATRIKKQKPKPLGARILVSPSAFQHWPEAEKHLVIRLPNEEIEYLPERPMQFDLFDCIYYLFCLRDHPDGENSFQHYIWSIASRCARLGSDFGTLAAKLVVTEYDNRANFETVLLRVNEVIDIYRKAQKADSPTNQCT
jgi:hypothetical protein